MSSMTLNILSRSLRRLADMLHPKDNLQEDLDHPIKSSTLYANFRKASQGSNIPSVSRVRDYSSHFEHAIRITQRDEQNDGDKVLGNLVGGIKLQQTKEASDTKSRSVSGLTLVNDDTNTLLANQPHIGKGSCVGVQDIGDATMESSYAHDTKDLHRDRMSGQDGKNIAKPTSLDPRLLSSLNKIARLERQVDDLSDTSASLQSQLGEVFARLQKLETGCIGSMPELELAEQHAASPLSNDEKEVMNLRAQLQVQKQLSENARAESKEIAEKHHQDLDEMRKFHAKQMAEMQAKYEQDVKNEKRFRKSAKERLEARYANESAEMQQHVRRQMHRQFSDEKKEWQKWIKMYSALGAFLYHRIRRLEDISSQYRGHSYRDQNDDILMENAEVYLPVRKGQTQMDPFGFDGEEGFEQGDEEMSYYTEEQSEATDEISLTSSRDEEELGDQQQYEADRPIAAEDFDEHQDWKPEDEGDGPHQETGKVTEETSNDPTGSDEDERRGNDDDDYDEDEEEEAWRLLRVKTDAELARSVQEDLDKNRENKTTNRNTMRDYTQEPKSTMGETSSKENSERIGNIGSLVARQAVDKPSTTIKTATQADNSPDHENNTTDFEPAPTFGVPLSNAGFSFEVGGPIAGFDISFADTSGENPFATKASSAQEIPRAEVEAAVKEALVERMRDEKKEDDENVGEDVKLSRQAQRRMERLTKKNERKAGARSRR